MTKTAVIVGAGPGIGLAVARRFGREGYRPVLLARRAQALAEYATDLTYGGIEPLTTAADAGDFASLVKAFQQIRTQAGDPAVLVYNPAAIVRAKASVLEADALFETLKVNVGGALMAAQQVIPAMRQAKSGTIIFTGSSAALIPAPDYAALGAGKAALRNLTFNLAAELAPAGIHVATVTVHGRVQPGSAYDPDIIADAYWRLHTQPPGQWETEIDFR